MSSSIEQALVGLVGLLTSAGRPLPFPNTLNGYVPPLDGIKREPGSDIVMQFQEGNVKPLDGGDSAHRTGVLAFCGSPIDANNLDKFYLAGTGLMVRHPTQKPWNNPYNCSRDQLIGYLAGCWRTGRTEIATGLYRAHADRGFFCQNTENDIPGSVKTPPLGDPLGPHHLMYMEICAGDVGAATDLVGQLALFTAIQTAADEPESEQNQLLLMSIVGCQLDFYLAHQTTYEAALHNYWSGEPWRGQKSIALGLLRVVELERGRYSTPNVLDYLIPQNILEELKHINLQEAVDAFSKGNPLYFAELVGKLCIATLRDIKHYVQLVLHSLNTLKNITVEIATGILKAVFSEAGKVLNKIRDLLGPLADPFGMLGAAISTVAALLGLGSTRSDADIAAEKQFRQDTLNGLRELAKKSGEILNKIADLQSSMEINFAALTRKMDGKFYDLVKNQLVGQARTVENLLSSLATPGLRYSEERRLKLSLMQQVEILQTNLDVLAAEGSPALPACFHAYGLVVACLTVLDNVAELKSTENRFRPIFQDLVSGPNGLNKTLVGLANEIKAAYAAFDKCRGKMLIGAVSIRNGYQNNMEDTKDILPNEGYQVTTVWCTVTGSIETMNFALNFSTENAGQSVDNYKIADGQNGINVFAGALFVAAPINFGRGLSKYWSPNLDALQASALTDALTTIKRDGGAAVQQFLQTASTNLANAKSAKPGYEVLATSVSAAFEERPVEGVLAIA
ncbi:MAG: hypothetical protein ABI671_14100 [Burkholderiales bacterium]